MFAESDKTVTTATDALFAQIYKIVAINLRALFSENLGAAALSKSLSTACLAPAKSLWFAPWLPITVTVPAP